MLIHHFYRTFILFSLCWFLCNNSVALAQATALDCTTYFAPHSSGIQNGGVQIIPVQTPQGTLNVWTKRIGNNPTVKLLLLNGGPGATHEYFECFESFLPAEGIEFIYYDQIGCGHSDNPEDTALWDLPRYVEEVEQVRRALQLDKDNFYLLGHSWGGILAMEYALKYQQHLKGLIISNMMSDAIAYDRYAAEVLAPQIEPQVLNEIRTIENNNDFGNPRYMELLMPHFYAKHICRLPLEAWPEPMTRSFNQINNSLYVTMQGPSEFGISGKLEQWSCEKKLKNLNIPTLVIGATHDTMDPQHLRNMATSIPKGQFWLCPNGSHMCMWDDQSIYFQGLLNFLKQKQ